MIRDLHFSLKKLNLYEDHDGDHYVYEDHDGDPGVEEDHDLDHDVWGPFAHRQNLQCRGCKTVHRCIFKLILNWTVFSMYVLFYSLTLCGICHGATITSLPLQILNSVQSTSTLNAVQYCAVLCSIVHWCRCGPKKAIYSGLGRSGRCDRTAVHQVGTLMMMITVMGVHLAITMNMTTAGDDGNEVLDRGEDYGDWWITSVVILCPSVAWIELILVFNIDQDFGVEDDTELSWSVSSWAYI